MAVSKPEPSTPREDADCVAEIERMLAEIDRLRTGTPRSQGEDDP